MRTRTRTGHLMGTEVKVGCTYFLRPDIETEGKWGKISCPLLLSDLPLAKPSWKPEGKGDQMVNSTGLSLWGVEKGREGWINRITSTFTQLLFKNIQCLAWTLPTTAT